MLTREKDDCFVQCCGRTFEWKAFRAPAWSSSALFCSLLAIKTAEIPRWRLVSITKRLALVR